jgi:hypothetical protein
MSQDAEKYLYFQVALLKDSFALDALKQDALKYHMLDHPGQLIAMRLTEYYELLSQGSIQPGASKSLNANPITSNNGEDKEAADDAGNNGVGFVADQRGDYHVHNDLSVTASPDVDQNAEEAAEYWSLL